MDILRTTIIGMMLVLITGCGQQELINEELIKIGVIMPLTGNFAQYGNEAKDGINLAIEESEVLLKPLYEDSKADTKEGVNSLNKLISANDVTAVIVGTSFVSMATAPIANQNQIIHFATFSSSPIYTTPNDYTFRLSPRAEIEAKILADYLTDKKIGIMFVNNDFGKTYRDAYAKYLGTRITHTESYESQTETDYRTQLTKIKASNVTALIIAGDARSTGRIISQSKQLGIKTKFYSLRSAEGKELLATAGNYAEELVYTYPSISSEFTQKFKTRFGYPPTAYSAEGYESMRLIIKAIKKCEKDKECMKNELLSFKNEQSAFGTISFDENGDVTYGFKIKKVRNNTFSDT